MPSRRSATIQYKGAMEACRHKRANETLNPSTGGKTHPIRATWRATVLFKHSCQLACAVKALIFDLAIFADGFEQALGLSRDCQRKI